MNFIPGEGILSTSIFKLFCLKRNTKRNKFFFYYSLLILLDEIILVVFFLSRCKILCSESTLTFLIHSFRGNTKLRKKHLDPQFPRGVQNIHKTVHPWAQGILSKTIPRHRTSSQNHVTGLPSTKLHRSTLSLGR